MASLFLTGIELPISMLQDEKQHPLISSLKNVRRANKYQLKEIIEKLHEIKKIENYENIVANRRIWL